MNNYFKFYITRDYDQLIGEVIDTNVIFFKIVDIDLTDKEVIVNIKKEDKDKISSIKGILEGGFYKIPLEFLYEAGNYELQILIIEEETTIEESAVNTFVYKPTVSYDKTLLEESPEYNFAVGLMEKLNKLQDALVDKIDTYFEMVDMEQQIQDYIDVRAEQTEKELDKNLEVLEEILGKYVIDEEVGDDTDEL